MKLLNNRCIMQLVFLFVLTCIIAWADASMKEPAKSKRLKLLLMIPFSALDVHQGRSMRIAADIVLDRINNRHDILANYHLELDSRDEMLGTAVAKNVIEYQRRTPPNEQSPLIIGPGMSTGCQAVGPILPHINVILLSTFCTAPSLSDHSLFPNLYTSISNGREAAVAMLQFMTTVGRWSRIAVFGNSGNVNDYQMAFILHKHAIELNYDVVWFDLFTDVSQHMVQPLLDLGVRIIAMPVSVQTILGTFLCEAYKVGMTGPRYVFVSQNGAFRNASFAGCTQEMMAAQWQQLFLFGWSQTPDNPAQVSELGYDSHAFEKMTRQRYPNATAASMVFSYVIHDAMLTAAKVLNETESLLQHQHNLTLSDYGKYPKLVEQLVNSSLLKSRVVGLRVGAMAYNDERQPQGDVQTILQWKPDVGLDKVGKVRKLSNLPQFRFNSYTFEHNSPIKWILGHPPIDKPKVEKRYKTIASSVTYVAVAISTLFSLAEIVLLVSMIVRRNSAIASWKTTAIGLLACLLMNGSSIGFSLDRGVDSTVRFEAPIVLLAMGGSALISLAVVNMFFVNRRLKHSVAKKQLGKSNISTRKGATIISAVNRAAVTKMPQTASDQVMTKEDHKIVALSTLFSVVLGGVLMGSVLAAHPSNCSFQPVDEEFFYDEVGDTNIETWLVKCLVLQEATMFFYSQLALIIFHLVALLFGLLLVYDVRNYLKQPSVQVDFNSKMIIFNICNTAALTIAGLLIVLILGGQPLSQQIALAYLASIVAAVQTLTWAYVTIRK